MQVLGVHGAEEWVEVLLPLQCRPGVGGVAVVGVGGPRLAGLCDDRVSQKERFSKRRGWGFESKFRNVNLGVGGPQQARKQIPAAREITSCFLTEGVSMHSTYFGRALYDQLGKGNLYIFKKTIFTDGNLS